MAEETTEAREEGKTVESLAWKGVVLVETNDPNEDFWVYIDKTTISDQPNFRIMERPELWTRLSRKAFKGGGNPGEFTPFYWVERTFIDDQGIERKESYAHPR